MCTSGGSRCIKISDPGVIAGLDTHSERQEVKGLRLEEAWEVSSFKFRVSRSKLGGKTAGSGMAHKWESFTDSCRA